jgi:hypothetical protein
VDYESQVRTAKPVVPFYADCIASNAVVPSASEARLDPFEKAARDFKVDDW